MRNYKHHRSHHRNPYVHRWFGHEVTRLARDFREGRSLYDCTKSLKKKIKEHLIEIGLSTTARERNQLMLQIQPVITNPRSEHGAYVKGAVEGIFDIILAEGFTSYLRDEM